jgi:hypothetical protein
MQLRWLSIWVVVAGFAVVTLGRSAFVGIPLRDPHGAIFADRVAISAALFVLLVGVDAWRRTPGRGRSARTVLATARERWPARRAGLAAAGLLAYHLVYLCYHNLKSWDVFNRPRDGFLLHVDRVLFLGHTPAVLLHDLLGQRVAAYVLLVVYESFSTLVTVAVVAAVVLPTRLRDAYLFLAGGCWVWILGVASYYAIPSLGPFHAAPRLFAGLPHTMVTDTQARYMAQRAFLLHHPGSPHAFAQVSAFASLHIAVTTFLLLMARHHRLRRTTIAMTVFLIGTLIATVYWGWHFAVDDVAGLLIAVVAVRLGSWTLHPPWQRAGAEPTPARWSGRRR